MSDEQQSETGNPFQGLFKATGFDMETPLQFRLFDQQICGGLQDNWLADAVEANGVTRAELDAMIAEGLLKRWKDNAGNEGFLLYAEQQAQMAKKLFSASRVTSSKKKSPEGLRTRRISATPACQSTT